MPAVVVMPSDAPALKARRVAADGAEIVVVGPASEERRLTAERIAAERGLTVIPPFDDDRIIAGQGTCGLEIAEDLPDLAAVLVPVGGGGLASGVAAAVRAVRPNARVIGVEPELAADARESLAAGRIVEWPAELVGRTIADGTRTQALGRRTFAHLSALLDRIVTVSEAEIAAAVRLAAEESRLVAEPSGALSVAALRFRARRGRARRGRRVRSSPSSAAATSTRSGIGRCSRRRSPLGADPRRPGNRLAGGPAATRRASGSAPAGDLPVRSFAGQPVGQEDLTLVDRAPSPRRPAAPSASRPRSSLRIQPASMRIIETMKTRSPTIHMIAPASCWSATAVGPHGRFRFA